MKISELLEERKQLIKDIERQNLYLELIEKSIVNMAKEDVKRVSNVYFSVFRNENDFKKYVKALGLSLKEVAYIDQSYMKYKEFSFIYKNNKWGIRIPYDIESSRLNWEIEMGVHDKLSVCLKENSTTTACVFRSDNLQDCVEYIKAYDEVGYEEKNKTN